jgi:hypothetical protein
VYHPGFQGSFSLKRGGAGARAGFGFADLPESPTAAQRRALWHALARASSRRRRGGGCSPELRAYCARLVALARVLELRALAAQSSP